MLVKAGDLIPVRPEAAAIPWTKRKSQVLNHLHRGPVSFQTFVYDTNVGDISTLAAYFNPSRWSEYDLNHKFGIQPQNSGPTEVSREAMREAKNSSKTHSICPRLLIYPEKAVDDKPNPEYFKSLTKFAYDVPAMAVTASSSGYSSAASNNGNSRSNSPEAEPCPSEFDCAPPLLMSSTWSPGLTTSMLAKAWDTMQSHQPKLPPPPPPLLQHRPQGFRAVTKSCSTGSPGRFDRSSQQPPQPQELPPGLKYLLEKTTKPAVPSKNALALDLSSALFQDTGRRANALGSRNQPCFSSSDIDQVMEGMKLELPIGTKPKAAERKEEEKAEDGSKKEGSTSSPERDDNNSDNHVSAYDSVFSTNAQETLV